MSPMAIPPVRPGLLEQTHARVRSRGSLHPNPDPTAWCDNNTKVQTAGRRWDPVLCGGQIHSCDISSKEGIARACDMIQKRLPVIMKNATSRLLHGADSEMSSIEALDQYLASVDVTVLRSPPKVHSGRVLVHLITMVVRGGVSSRTISSVLGA